MAHSGNQAKPVVVLLVVLGSRTAEELAAKTLVTYGLKVRTPANVSARVIACNYVAKR